MFVSDDLFLIWNFHLNHRVFVKDNGLTAKPAFNSRVDGTVDEVFFFIADLFQRIFAFINVDMACTAGADFSAVVVQVDTIIFCHFQNTYVDGDVLDRFRCDALIFKSEFYGGHIGQG